MADEWVPFTITITGRVKVAPDAVNEANENAPIDGARAAVDLLSYDAVVQIVEPSEDLAGVETIDVDSTVTIHHPTGDA